MVTPTVAQKDLVKQYVLMDVGRIKTAESDILWPHIESGSLLPGDYPNSDNSLVVKVVSYDSSQGTIKTLLDDFKVDQDRPDRACSGTIETTSLVSSTTATTQIQCNVTFNDELETHTVTATIKQNATGLDSSSATLTNELTYIKLDGVVLDPAAFAGLFNLS